MPRPRSNAYKPLWGLFAIILGVTTLTVIAKLIGGKDRIPWRTSYAAGLEEARRDGKPTLLYFTASWCGPCQRMKSSTWADADVEQRLRAYVPVKIDIDEDPETAIRYPTAAIPTFVLLDKDGNVTRWTDGYYAADEFLEWLGK